MAVGMIREWKAFSAVGHRHVTAGAVWFVTQRIMRLDQFLSSTNLQNIRTICDVYTMPTDQSHALVSPTSIDAAGVTHGQQLSCSIQPDDRVHQADLCACLRHLPKRQLRPVHSDRSGRAWLPRQASPCGRALMIL